MDEKLTCKGLWGFGIENYPEDIKTKLILDYEKLYYRFRNLTSIHQSSVWLFC